MNYLDTFLEILKYILPSVVVLIATFLIVNKFLVTETRKKQLAVFQDGLKASLHLRLLAYERLAIFVERISPRSLIVRLYQSNMTVKDLQIAAVHAIREEFEHNLSQQIYVSTQVWGTVQSIKEQQLVMINQMASTLNPDASAKELHKMILDYIMTTEDKLPTDIALEVINNEAKLVLSQSA